MNKPGFITDTFTDCTEEEYNNMMKLVKEVDLSKVIEEQDNTNRTELLACVGGICVID